MRLLMSLLMWITLLPMAALLVWIWPALKKRWQAAGRWAHASLALAWLAGAAALLAFPHEDVFTGLDVMAYRKMTNVFLEGRGFHDRDIVLEKVPNELRQYLYFQPGPLGRPTRDLLFQLSNWQGVETAPFFLPIMPLAADGLAPVLSPDRFIPLMGAVWLALVLAAGFYAGRGWGVAVCVALVLGTAWPAWFLRGFFSEGMGAILATAVVAAAAVRPLRNGIMLVVGFVLGLSVSCHPTLAFLALPIGLGLAAERGRWGETGRLAVGAALGILPLLAMTKWVCQPYGNFLNWKQLQWLLSVAPEHRAVAIGLSIFAVAGIGLLAVCHSGRVRVWLESGWQRLALTISLATVCLAALLTPILIGGIILTGWTAVWSGIGWGFAGLVVAGGVCVFAMRRPMRERFWLATICAAATLFIYLKGMETPAGLWSQRRFLPIVLAMVALLAAPLSAGLSACMVRWRRAGWVLALLIMWAGLWNVAHWPAAFFTINDRGATKWTQDVAERIGTNRWVVFDYYPHSVPYAADLQHRVLGLNEVSRDHWPEVAGWIASIAKNEEIWAATSWTPCTLEDGFRLDGIFAKPGRFPIVRTQSFFPAEPDTRVVENHFMRVVPLMPGETAAQDKYLDGSPIGLRGSWGTIRQGTTWTRQGSGIVGPVPKKGGRVAFVADCAWTPPNAEWSEQILLVTPPWGGVALQLKVPIGDHVVQGTLDRPMIDKQRSGTGIYSISVKRPYNPAQYELRGYPPDLGVLMRRITIR